MPKFLSYFVNVLALLLFYYYGRLKSIVIFEIFNLMCVSDVTYTYVYFSISRCLDFVAKIFRLSFFDDFTIYFIFYFCGLDLDTNGTAASYIFKYSFSRTLDRSVGLFLSCSFSPPHRLFTHTHIQIVSNFVCLLLFELCVQLDEKRKTIFLACVSCLIHSTPFQLCGSRICAAFKKRMTSVSSVGCICVVYAPNTWRYVDL